MSNTVLKDNGCNIFPDLDVYDIDLTLHISQTLVKLWLLYKYGINIVIKYSDTQKWQWYIQFVPEKYDSIVNKLKGWNCESYDKAHETALNKTLEYVKTL